MVWVPNPVQEQVQVTVMKPQITEQPYQYCVTVCKPETRTMTVNVCSYENRTQSCTERVCEFHNETRTRTFCVTECKAEARTREVQYTECVPQKRTCTEQVVRYRDVSEETDRAVHGHGSAPGGKGSLRPSVPHGAEGGLRANLRRRMRRRLLPMPWPVACCCR